MKVTSMNILKKYKEKMKLYEEQVLAELKQEHLEKAGKEFDAELKNLTQLKPKIKRITKGYTKPEKFISPVRAILIENNFSVAKKVICERILSKCNLTEKDVEKLSDGVPRFHKTLDKTRRLMKDQGVLDSKNGIWTLMAPNLLT